LTQENLTKGMVSCQAYNRQTYPANRRLSTTTFATIIRQLEPANRETTQRQATSSRFRHGSCILRFWRRGVLPVHRRLVGWLGRGRIGGWLMRRRLVGLLRWRGLVTHGGRVRGWRRRRRITRWWRIAWVRRRLHGLRSRLVLRRALLGRDDPHLVVIQMQMSALEDGTPSAVSGALLVTDRPSILRLHSPSFHPKCVDAAIDRKRWGELQRGAGRKE
jgi:hypothetical protein